MKTKTLLTCFFLFYYFVSTAQYTWSNPQPTGFSNTKVVFTDSNTGYIMTSDGDLLKTTDRGITWNKYKHFPLCRTLDVQDSFFVIGGADTTVYISTDGAQSWNKNIIRKNGEVEKIQIINKDTIFAFLKNGISYTRGLHMSTDGGINWQLVNESLVIMDLDFIDSKLGYAASYGSIYKTIDGGKTWQQLPTPAGGTYRTVSFLNKDIGYASRSMGETHKTIDGGLTWTFVNNLQLGDIKTISFVGASTVFMAGDGVIFRSTDAGNTWVNLHYPYTQYQIYSMHFFSATSGFFVGFRGQITKTTDGGNSFIDYSPAYNDIKPISFPTPQVGYAGTWDRLLKTTDYGQTWSKLPFSAGPPLYKRIEYLHFFSEDTGLALVRSPVQLFKTDNGGQSFQEVMFPIPNSYMDFIRGFFVIGNTIYLSTAGNGYSILKSEDRGSTWSIVTRFGQSGYGNLFFTDERTGYGTSGSFLYKTTDSAKTWTNIFITDMYTINSVWFTSVDTGFIAGRGGFNFKTTDSGRTWNRFAITPENYNFDEVYALRFFNKNVGYLVSDWGGFYKTSNGGLSWKAEKKLPGNGFTIQMTPDTTVYVGGMNGIILKKDMREYSIDALKATHDVACGARISAEITAVLSSVDSVWIEYGITGFTSSILATPFAVTDSTVKSETTLHDLMNDSIYVARVKVLYNNSYHYSDSIYFLPKNNLPKPVITYNGNLMSSSATTGNQWFLNGVAIAGATAVTYQPINQGIYTVQQKENECTSVMSSGFNYVATSINDPVLAGAIEIFPNPVRTTLWIKNNHGKKLQVTLIDSWGRIIQVLQTSNTEIKMNMQMLPSGIYNLVVEELINHKKATFKILKM